MKLAVLVNTDRHVNHVVGIVKAALAKGHEVLIFAMDDGTKLLANLEFAELCRTKGVCMSFCNHSAKGLNVATEGLPAEIVCGSQYHNAVMNRDADRLIVL